MDRTVYDFSVRTKDGSTKSLADYRDKALVIVNVASKCGLTPQYEALQALYSKYESHGLVILGFPCNQFQNQEPGTDAEITEFCTINYGVTFPIFAKIDVNGEHEDPLYTWLKEQKKDLLVISAIEWNFSKFLIDREGRVIDRYLPTTDPMSMEADIRRALGLAAE
jgi:glutathione peroxidase